MRLAMIRIPVSLVSGSSNKKKRCFHHVFFFFKNPTRRRAYPGRMRLLQRLRPVIRAAVILIALLGTYAIAAASLVYFNDEELPPFLLEKWPLPLEGIWLSALKIHIASALFCLPSCALLIWHSLMKRAPKLHRWLGRISLVIVSLALVPTGFYLAFFAKGGVASTVGFLLTGGICLFATIRAVSTARAGDFISHRRWALHVFAQLSVALTSRAMLIGFDALAVDAHLAYLISLWLPVVGSAITVEILTQPKNKTNRKIMKLALTTTLLMVTFAAASVAHSSESQEQAERDEAKRMVQAKLVTPLAKKEDKRSSFSRKALPPEKRRIRILNGNHLDSKSKRFFAFSIDERFGRSGRDSVRKWNANTITGCVYPDSGELYVLRGKHHYPSSLLLGKRKKPSASHICRLKGF